MSWWKLGLVALVWTIAAAAPAAADHLTLTPEARPGTLPAATPGVSPAPRPEVTPAPRGEAYVDVPAAVPPESAAPSPDVRVDMKFGADGFRLGGSVSDERGTYGAWVDGRRVGRGLVLNGQVQTKTGTRTYSFTLDPDMFESMAKALARQWLYSD